MKKWMMVVAGIAVVAGLGTGAAFYFTAGMVDSAEGFFQAVTQEDMAKARGYLAESVKAGTDETALEQFLSQSGILKFKEAHWSYSRKILAWRVSNSLESTFCTDRSICNCPDESCWLSLLRSGSGEPRSESGFEPTT